VHDVVAIPTIADLSRHHAGIRPGRVALIFEDETLTYGALDHRANQVANGLLAAGLKPAARVAQLSKNAPNYFELLYGATKSRTVLVPVNFRLAPPEIAFVINDAKAEILFVGRDFYAVIEGIRGELNTVRQIVALDGGHADWPDYAAWRDGQNAIDPKLPVQASDVAVQMYTSGTTGHPKGAQLTHHNFMALLPRALQEWGLWSDDDVVLVCMPLFHIAGGGWGLVGLFCGVPNLITRDIDPAAILAAIPKYRITKALFVPAVILFLLQTPGCAETDFSSLDLIAYGASPIPLDLLKRAIATFNCGFVQLYGLTETTGGITYLPPEDHGEHAGQRMKSCGKPMPGVEIEIRDAEDKALPPGEVGEIVCRSPQIMAGYWNLPEATAKSIRKGWFYTGDAGYLDADGYLYIYDRVKDMIVSGGENIYPAEVESALFGHPAIADVAVIGVPDEKWGEAVKAVVVRKPGVEISAEGLIAFARTRIAGYKVPKSVDFVQALPRNPSGKLLKREIRKPYWVNRERQVN